MARTLRGNRGCVRIFATETPLDMAVLPVLEKLRLRYPDITVRLFGGGSTMESVEALRAGEVDVPRGVTPAFSAEESAAGC